MKRIRVWVQAEYEFPDDVEIVKVGNETAFRIGDGTLRPTLEFLRLVSADETSSEWADASTEQFEAMLEAEHRLSLDVLSLAD